MSAVLQYDRGRLLPHIYLLFTGHFTHWTFHHMAVDTVVFCVISYLCHFFNFQNKFSNAIYVSYLSAAAVAISLVISVLQPEIKWYRGLSGINWALYGVLVVHLYYGKRRLWQGAAVTMVVIFFTLISLQLAGGHSMLVTYMGPGVVNMPLAHITGAVTGVAAACIVQRLHEKRHAVQR